MLHGEAASLMDKIRANAHYVPPVADPLDPVTFVDKIKVPTFMACQWEDEQTGGHCPDLVQHFTGTKQKWFTFTNGAHVDSLDPATFDRWYDFLELFVAHQAPIVNQAVIRAAAPVIYQSAMGLPDSDIVTLPPDPIQEEPTYQSALCGVRGAARGQGPVRQRRRHLADRRTNRRRPVSGFRAVVLDLPGPGHDRAHWYFGPDGTLTDQSAAKPGIDQYTSNPKALPPTDFGNNTGSGGLWGNASQWQWNWKQNPAGTAVSYVSAPLKTNTTVIGGGAVHLWVRSSTPDVDLQATVSEVRPDGNETFVQNGWMRASERKLSTGSQQPVQAARAPCSSRSPASWHPTSSRCRRHSSSRS